MIILLVIFHKVVHFRNKGYLVSFRQSPGHCECLVYTTLMFNTPNQSLEYFPENTLSDTVH